MEKEKRIQESCLRIQEQLAEFQRHIQMTETYWEGKAAELHCEVMSELLEAMTENLQRIKEGESLDEHG